ncbi:hypothetical protein [Halobellus limi]|uniref:Uncharacterized protein n=1 Tax=Halobellus limi TaxID=699433 RepID=A0A1H5ZFA0_9EURY|nr:hypothetical protein [Halobellus limi]QCC48111.1 hypothetical protein DV707_10805 [Halobellus limi]SEG35173.1 hypothetical protein SAMN04488133_1981 [Halobellus limi]
MSDVPTIQTQSDYHRYIKGRAYDEIRETIENLSYRPDGRRRWSGDVEELEEEVFDRIHYSVECYDELTYNYPAFWGLVAHFSDATEDDVEMYLHLSDPRSTLRELAYACVVTDLQPAISEILSLWREYPEVFALFDGFQVSPASFEIDGFLFKRDTSGELMAFNEAEKLVESYTPSAYAYNHDFPEEAFLENVDELISYNPEDVCDWLNRER